MFTNILRCTCQDQSQCSVDRLWYMKSLLLQKIDVLEKERDELIAKLVVSEETLCEERQINEDPSKLFMVSIV